MLKMINELIAKNQLAFFIQRYSNWWAIFVVVVVYMWFRWWIIFITAGCDMLCVRCARTDDRPCRKIRNYKFIPTARTDHISHSISNQNKNGDFIINKKCAPHRLRYRGRWEETKDKSSECCAFGFYVFFRWKRTHELKTTESEWEANKTAN